MRGGPGAAAKHGFEVASNLQNLGIVCVCGAVVAWMENSTPDLTLSMPVRSNGATDDVFWMVCPKTCTCFFALKKDDYFLSISKSILKVFKNIRRPKMATTIL